MEKIKKGEPCLILMNHSCFLDLMIASKIFFPRPYCIICTSDGFVGLGGLKETLMRAIGCVPTRKFVTDLRLVQDIDYCLHTLGVSVLMYPEASYSFDGTATPLPRKLGVLLKKCPLLWWRPLAPLPGIPFTTSCRSASLFPCPPR